MSWREQVHVCERTGAKWGVVPAARVDARMTARATFRHGLPWDVRDLLAHGGRMSYRIPIGTEIFPYASESGEVGIGRLTTVEVEVDDTAQRLTLPDPVTGDRA